MARPGTLDLVGDLEIYRGDTYELPLRLRSIDDAGILGAYLDLTGWALKAQLRDTTDAAVLAEFTVTLGDQTVSGTKGTLTLSLTHAQTTALAPDVTTRWDLQYTLAGKVKTLLKGAVNIEGEITE